MTHLARRLLRDERGATAIEYTLIAILTGIVAIGGLSIFGSAITGKFFLVQVSVQAATS